MWKNICSYIPHSNVLKVLVNDSHLKYSRDKAVPLKMLWTENPTLTGLGLKAELCTEKPGLNRRAIGRDIAA
jgi:hypothetical protein